MVAAALASCPNDEWISADSLFTTMRRGNMSPTIVRSEMALWKLYLEGRYTLAVLFEYASTLGLLDLDDNHPTGARDDFQENWVARIWTPSAGTTVSRRSGSPRWAATRWA